MKRLFFVAAVGLGAVACGSSQAALTVNGETVIERDELFDQIDEQAIAADAGEQAAYPQQLVGERLTLAAQVAVVEALLDEVGLELERTGDDAADIGTGLQILQAEVASVAEVTEDDIEAAFDELGPVELSCARHILTTSEQEADDALARIDDGEDFESVAAEVSLDGSGANGGDLGCAPLGAYVEPFDSTVWAADPGDLVGPVETEFGFHLIEIYERRPQQLDEVRATLQQQLAQAASSDAQTAFGEYISERLPDFDIEVDSRHGVWDPETFTVLPPEGAFVPPVAAVDDPLLIDPAAEG